MLEVDRESKVTVLIQINFTVTWNNGWRPAYRKQTILAFQNVPKCWTNQLGQITLESHDETEIILYNLFGLPNRQVFRTFRNYLKVKKIPVSLLPLVSPFPPVSMRVDFLKWIWSSHLGLQDLHYTLYSQQFEVYQIDWTSIAAIYTLVLKRKISHNWYEK